MIIYCLIECFFTSLNISCVDVLNMKRQVITVVSGLPRSGTSMMMSMLEAGGIPVLTDNLREPDEDNLKGYFEYEQVKQIEEDQSWLPQAEGKVVKLISALLKHLTPDYQYKIIFMRRRIEEILASQKRMLERRGEPTDTVPDDLMAQLFDNHIQEVQAWMESQPNIDYIEVDYNKALENPEEEIKRVNVFLDGDLDESEMMKIIEPRLYRQRK